MKTHPKSLSLLISVIILILFASSCKKDTVKLAGISLDQSNTNLAMGSTVTLNVSFNPANASNKTVTWQSSDQNIATVGSDGTVTAVGLGTATITAVSSENSALLATCTISVLPADGQSVNVSGNIASDTRWFGNAVYLLNGYVYVKDGATLTIDPGTIIKGVSGTKAALVIERGGKIMAAGTSDKPIVFTSDKPAGQRAYGDWGGVVICGKAPTNRHDVSAGVGISEGGIGSLYGGSDPADNSGTFQYVRIEFAGAPLANNKTHGFTLYSVGSGTTIDHIQVSFSGSDSYRWQGGTVNAKYLIAFRGMQDDWDTENGYSGKVQFFITLRDPAVADATGSNGFLSENDADGSSLTPVTAPVFVNGSVLGPLVTSSTTYSSTFRNAIMIRRGSRLSVYNSVLAGWPAGVLIDGSLGDSPAQATANTLQIENTILSGMLSAFPSATNQMNNIAAWFGAVTRNNSIVDTNDLLMLNSAAFNITAPVWIPQVNSPILAGAIFTNQRLTDSFFSPVSYRGAFGVTNWAAGWANFNPQNATY